MPDHPHNVGRRREPTLLFGVAEDSIGLTIRSRRAARAVKCRDWRRSGNRLQKPQTPPGPPRPPATPTGPGDDAQTFLEHARTVSLDRAAHLPNFIADEMADCYSGGPILQSPNRRRHSKAPAKPVSIASSKGSHCQVEHQTARISPGTEALAPTLFRSSIQIAAPLSSSPKKRPAWQRTDDLQISDAARRLFSR